MKIETVLVLGGLGLLFLVVFSKITEKPRSDVQKVDAPQSLWDILRGRVDEILAPTRNQNSAVRPVQASPQPGAVTSSVQTSNIPAAIQAVGSGVAAVVNAINNRSGRVNTTPTATPVATPALVSPQIGNAAPLIFEPAPTSYDISPTEPGFLDIPPWEGYDFQGVNMEVARTA